MWTLAEASRAYQDMVNEFHFAGYILTIYGSVLKGKGRDLDLMVIPWRPSPTPPKIIFEQVCANHKLSPDVGKPYRGVMKTWSKTASDRRGKIYDFQFRSAEVTLEEAFEFSMRVEA